jgi:DNA transformation protein
MAASEGFAEFLHDQLAPLGRITMRRMFGKTGVFCDGFMLAMVRDNTLYFRVDDDNRAAFKEAEAFPPLDYRKKGGTIDLSFWRAPERLFASQTSSSFGRGLHSEPRGGLLRRENAQRESENQCRKRSDGMR